MLLIADSGSTKTDWVAFHDGRKIFEQSTQGLNPLFHSKQEIRNTLRSVNFLRDFRRRISEVRFFGAGCADKKGKEKVEGSLNAFFSSAIVKVETDLMGAALAACGKEKGIVCILGTGSNCCYYDGQRIYQGNAGLGYVLGDEASGAFYGKKILQRFLYGKLSADLARDFK
jgi:N-acetylglucosamine kinase-like BadF-type ATPase